MSIKSLFDHRDDKQSRVNRKRRIREVIFQRVGRSDGFASILQSVYVCARHGRPDYEMHSLYLIGLFVKRMKYGKRTVADRSVETTASLRSRRCAAVPEYRIQLCQLIKTIVANSASIRNKNEYWNINRFSASNDAPEDISGRPKISMYIRVPSGGTNHESVRLSKV